MITLSELKNELQAILNELEEGHIGEEKHNKSASRRTRTKLSALKNNITEYKKMLLKLDNEA